MEKIIFGHVNLGMLIVFLVALSLVFLNAARKTEENGGGYHIKNYMKLTLRNILFHTLASFLVLMLIHEVGEFMVNWFSGGKLQSDNEHKYLYFLSGLSGFFGGPAVARLLEYGRKKLNQKDQNIMHKHGENCDHNE